VKTTFNGPVQGLPAELQCGHCGCLVTVKRWQGANTPDGELIGAMAVQPCPSCDRAVVGILANDEATARELQEIAQASFG